MSRTAAHKLARLARAAGTERVPFYVRRPISPALLKTFPAEGWYWVPAGHHTAVYLGGSEIDAAVALHRIIADQEQEDAA